MQTAWIAHWLLAFFFVLAGAAPWVYQFRFSLRTLLLATTLIAVGLGLIVWLSR